jgi:membrane protease subunit HflC
MTVVGVIKTALATLGVAVAIAGCSGLYTIDQREQAVVTQFGRPVRVILNPVRKNGDEKKIESLKENYSKQGISVAEGPGLYWKTPFIQSVKRFDRRLLRWDGFPEEVPTVDKKYIWVDTTARWEIVDPLTYMTKVGTEETGHARLDDIIDSTTRNSLTKRDIISIVRTDDREMRVIEKELAQTTDFGKVIGGRPAVVKEISDKVAETSKQYGIGIYGNNGVLIKGLNYVSSVQDSLIQRMISERQRIAQRYESEGDGEYRKIMGDKEKKLKEIQSGAYKQAREIEGKADAKATEIYALMLNKDPEFYRFARTLELYESSIGTNTVLILGTDNSLLEFVKGIRPASTNSTVAPAR